MKSKIIITIVLTAAALFISMSLIGQPFDPPDGGGSPGGRPVGAPIDGGLSALIAAGAALIGRKFFKDRKKRKENE